MQTIRHILLSCPFKSYPGPTTDFESLMLDAIFWLENLDVRLLSLALLIRFLYKLNYKSSETPFLIIILLQIVDGITPQAETAYRSELCSCVHITKRLFFTSLITI